MPIPAAPHRLVLALAVLLAAALAGPAPAAAAWVWPVSGEVITPYRNGTDPYATGQHRGIDIAAPVGTPVVAAAGGEVRFAGTAGSSGITIGIRTRDGYDTSYLHLSSLSVKAGTQVSPGDRIGAVGTTGTRSTTAPHLHFGVRAAGTRHDYHDPLALLPPPPSAPAPGPPAAAPAPAPAPVPPAAPPVTAPRAAPLPAFRHRRALRRAPHPRAAPLPRAAHELRTVPVLETAPHPRTALSARTGAHSRGAPARHPDSGHTPRQRPIDEVRYFGRPAAPAAAPRQPSGRPGESGGGLDIGWITACAGLLLAAALLGLSADHARGETVSGRRFTAAIRPLIGRR